MWVAKVRISGEKALIGSKAKEYKVSVSGYPVSFYQKRDGIYVYVIGFVFGNDKNKKEFIKDLKKSERVLNLEGKGDFFIGQLKEPLNFKQVYYHGLVHLEPIIIKEDGSEFWTVGCWNRKKLMKFVKLFQRTRDGKLLKIENQKISNFSILSVQPKLTDKQKKALELAIKNGYYDYPRNIELEKLADLMKISYSTYQAHLRKAEKKLLPFFFERA